MWNTEKVSDSTVYWQRNDGVKYEIHSSNKLELIVRNRDQCTTHYFRFDGNSAKNYRNEFYDEQFVEETVKSIPELEGLPKTITDALKAVKKIEKKPEPPIEQA